MEQEKEAICILDKAQGSSQVSYQERKTRLKN